MLLSIVSVFTQLTLHWSLAFLASHPCPHPESSSLTVMHPPIVNFFDLVAELFCLVLPTSQWHELQTFSEFHFFSGTLSVFKTLTPLSQTDQPWYYALLISLPVGSSSGSQTHGVGAVRIQSPLPLHPPHSPPGQDAPLAVLIYASLCLMGAVLARVPAAQRAIRTKIDVFIVCKC